MYRCLNPDLLGINGRQSELIELALNYGYRGLDLEISELIKRAQKHGVEQAGRFLASAGIKICGFPLDVQLQADDSEFNATLIQLAGTAKIAAGIGATGCYLTIDPGSDEKPFHDNFEFHLKRLGSIAETLAGHELQLGVSLAAAPKRREGRAYPFVHRFEEIVSLVKSMSATNVGLILDTWNWHVGGGQVAHLADLSVERIFGVRLSDIPADADLSAIDETQCVLPGDVGGLVDNQAVLAWLADAGYQGPTTVYAHPDCFAGMSSDATLKRIKETFQAQCEAVGIDEEGDPLPVVAVAEEAVAVAEGAVDEE